METIKDKRNRAVTEIFGHRIREGLTSKVAFELEPQGSGRMNHVNIWSRASTLHYWGTPFSFCFLWNYAMHSLHSCTWSPWFFMGSTWTVPARVHYSLKDEMKEWPTSLGLCCIEEENPWYSPAFTCSCPTCHPWAETVLHSEKHSFFSTLSAWPSGICWDKAFVSDPFHGINLETAKETTAGGGQPLCTLSSLSLLLFPFQC